MTGLTERVVGIVNLTRELNPRPDLVAADPEKLILLTTTASAPEFIYSYPF